MTDSQYDWVGGDGGFNDPSMWRGDSSGAKIDYPPNSQSTVLISTDKDITVDTKFYDGLNYGTTASSITFAGTGTVTVTGPNGISSDGGITIGNQQTVVLDGTTMSASKTVSGGTIKLENAANLSVNSSLDTTTIDFGGNSTGSGHNTVTLGSASYSISNITNFGPDDSIVVQYNYSYNNVEWIKTGTNTYALVGVNANGTTSTSSGENYIVQNVSFAQKGTDSSGNPVYYTPADLYGGAASAGTVSSGTFAGDTYYMGNGLSSTSDNTLTITCFLPGSMIRTPEGDVVVEDLQIGDDVITFNCQTNKNVSQPVIWAGKAHATVRPELADDEAGYPVRIIKNAIADGVPYKDMLITAEHCLFFDGKFVPVRMLVNGTSIFYDKSITSYDYYHVETAQHSVITADGMLTESYLDTGNRSAFQQAGKVVRIGGSVKSWAEDAGAPLCVDRAFVEPLFHNLAERSNTVADAHVPAEPVATTSNPDLHLVTETGATIRPIRHDGQQYSFMLPSGTKSLRIVSRASRPSDMIGPFVDDRRYMGVAVADVLLHCAKQSYNITTHLQAEKPQGWYETDWTDCAWTNGDAVLPLDGSLTQGKMGILTLTIRAAGPYLINTQPTAEKLARSA